MVTLGLLGLVLALIAKYLIWIEDRAFLRQPCKHNIAHIWPMLNAKQIKFYKTFPP